MGVVANSLGLGAEMTIDGKVWTVSPWNLEIQGLFERYLERYAIETHKRLEGLLGAETASKQLNAVMSDIILGKYSFGTERMAEALDTPLHISYLLFLFLKKNHPEVSREEAGKLVREHYADVLKAVNVANADPNREKTAATSPTGQQQTV